MTRTPPLLPAEALTRVLRLARFDGMGVLVCSGLFAILSALGHDVLGTIIGLLVAGAGAMELHGGTLLEHRLPRGMTWLIVSQLFLMVSVLVYCRIRLNNIDLSLLRAAVTSDLKSQLAANGWGVDDFLRFTYRLVFFVVAAATIVYQGTMAAYYYYRRRAITRALEEEVEP
jgi:hypothetical protein